MKDDPKEVRCKRSNGSCYISKKHTPINNVGIFRKKVCEVPPRSLWSSHDLFMGSGSIYFVINSGRCLDQCNIERPSFKRVLFKDLYLSMLLGNDNICTDKVWTIWLNYQSCKGTTTVPGINTVALFRHLQAAYSIVLGTKSVQMVAAMSGCSGPKWSHPSLCRSRHTH